jgi:hypothetical protein
MLSYHSAFSHSLCNTAAFPPEKIKQEISTGMIPCDM